MALFLRGGIVQSCSLSRLSRLSSTGAKITALFHPCRLYGDPALLRHYHRGHKKKDTVDSTLIPNKVYSLTVGKYVDTPEANARTDHDFQRFEHLETAMDDLHRFESEVLIKARVEDELDEDEAQKGNVENIHMEMYSGPDPSIPISDVPCGGCGAKLHCQDPGIPGYVPSGAYQSVTPALRSTLQCQRCELIRKHNLCLNVAVDADEYRRIVMEPLKHKKALILLVVDLTDLGNSIIPDFSECVGDEWTVVLVGNKADMIPGDGKTYLKTLRTALHHLVLAKKIQRDLVKHICVVSAKTEFGIEDLVTEIMMRWSRKHNMFILGNTNVGKSTLFNCLLSSDLCNVNARYFIHRATTSIWPGTTLNLLKFPVLSASDAEIRFRQSRITRQLKEQEENLEMSRGQNITTSLVGHIGQTFTSKNEVSMTVAQERELEMSQMMGMYQYDLETGSVAANKNAMQTPEVALDPSVYENSRLCYDTPGVVNENQIINYLTQHELSYILTVDSFIAQTYLLKPKHTMFISGLVRIDHGASEKSVYLTLVTSPKIPVSVVRTDKAEAYYQDKLYTESFGLPVKDESRPKPLPPVVSQNFNITGIGLHQCAADITLSSFGWVGVTCGRASGAYMSVDLTVSMPGGIGCALRDPPLLPTIIQRKGKKNSRHNRFEVK